MMPASCKLCDDVLENVTGGTGMSTEGIMHQIFGDAGKEGNDILTKVGSGRMPTTSTGSSGETLDIAQYLREHN